MREPKQLQNLYRYNPGEIQRVGRGIKPFNPEEENERCYELVHIKLAPRRLNTLSLLNIILLIGIVLVLFVSTLVMPKPTESRVEKRDLAKPPEFSASSLFSGQFSRDVETYFSDTFPFREWFVTLSAMVEQNQGVRFDNVRIVSSGKDAQNMTAAPIVPSSTQSLPISQQATPSTPDQDNLISSISDPPSPPSQPVDENATGTVSNGIFISNGRAMSLYGGSHESARRYAGVLNSYRQALPDVQIYNMIIPTAAEFYLPQKYRSMSQSQKEVIDLIYGLLDPGIKKVDAYDALAAHTDEYLYFRTDHHWTGRGAYYAYQAFCDQAGLIPLSIDSFDTHTLQNFIGTMYAQTQDSTLLETPDYVDYYLFDQSYSAVRYDKGAPYNPIPHKLWGEYAKSPNSYSVFLQGDFPLIEVDTGLHNGRKIAVVKESFGNAFVPFLINHYEKVYIVDERYFERPFLNFLKENNIRELLFANNAFAVCTPYQISCIENLKYNVYVAPPQTPPVEPSAVPDSEQPEPEGSQEDVDEEERPRVQVRPKHREGEGLLKPRKAS